VCCFEHKTIEWLLPRRAEVPLVHPAHLHRHTGQVSIIFERWDKDDAVYWTATCEGDIGAGATPAEAFESLGRVRDTLDDLIL
jgi:hypothetical protein